MRPSRRLRLACALAVALAATAACSALVGVEDVTLAPKGDGGDRDAGVGSGRDGAIDAPASPEASVQLGLGFLHTCARRTDGVVRCWGDNSLGQLGDGVPFGDGGDRPPALVPQKVVGVSGAVAVTAGVAHSCAITQGGGVSCWGYNAFGQLGNGTTDKSSSPVTVTGVRGAIALSAGTSFTCALLADGTASCWGANYSGQLGDGTIVDRPTAAPVQQLRGAVGIAAAEHHACALLASGGVTCWGQNEQGQLGDGTTTDSFVPTAVASLSDAVEVGAASRFTCARSRSGQVSCWGANGLGELGTGSPNDSPNPTPRLTAVTDARALGVGYQHACAARATGEVVCWGAAGSGQVGSGSVPDDASIPRPTLVIGLSRALSVATGGDHSCATTSAGAVLCWGENGVGQLGNGSVARAYAAVPVSGFP